MRSTWMYKCWKIHGAVVYAVMCSRPGMVRMGGQCGFGLRMNKSSLDSPSCVGF